MKKKVVLNLTEWQSEMLYYLQKKTDMTYAQICRGALNDYLHQVFADFTYNTYGSAQSRIAEADFEYSTLISMEPHDIKSLYYAWRDFKTWDEDLKEMSEPEAQTFKMLAWELLLLLKRNAGTIIFREVVDRLGIEYPVEIAPRLLVFLRRQSQLFEYMDIIQIDNAESVKKSENYYDKKWREYGNIIKKKIEEYENSKTREIEILKSEGEK